MIGLFMIRKAAHARRHNDETCLCCLTCYKRYGVGFRDRDCEECLGVCSTEEHVEWLKETFEMKDNVEIVLSARVRVGEVRIPRPIMLVRADGSLVVLEAGTRIQDCPIEIVETEARVL